MSSVALALGLPFTMPKSSGGGATPHIFDTLGATWWIDAAEEPQVSGAQYALNRGNQNIPHARFGSAGRAELRGSYGLILSGATSNGTTTSDYAASRPTGDLEIVARIAAADWTPGASSTIVVSGTSAAATQNYRLSLHNTGALLLERYVSGGGASLRYAYSTLPVPSNDGEWIWIKATVDIDNGSGGTDFYFYTASDSNTEPSSWTQLGTKVTTSVDGTGVGNSNTTGLFVGQQSSGNNPWTGSIKRVIVRNGIGGTIVFDADFTKPAAFSTSFTEDSSNAATVTINTTSGVDTNDPFFGYHTGENYLYLPGLANNTASTPDSSALDIAGDIDIQIRLAADDWTPSANLTIVSKYNNDSAGNYSFAVSHLSTGVLRIAVSPTGASADAVVCDSTANLSSLTDGQPYWIRATMDVNDGSGNRVAKFYTSLDGETPTWTQLGSTVTTVGATSIGNSVATLRIGSGRNGDTGMYPGKYYRVIIKDGYDGAGSAVFDADFTTNTNQNSFTESSSNAATVTINRATSGRKAMMVTRPVWLFGTDDYMEVPDNGLLEINANDFTVVAVVRPHTNLVSNARFVSKRTTAAGNYGWELLNAVSIGLQIYGLYDTSTGDTGTASADFTLVTGTAVSVGFVVNDAAGTLNTFKGSTFAANRTLPTNRDARNTSPLSIGRFEGGSTYFDGELFAVAIFRSALDSTALGQIVSYFGV